LKYNKENMKYYKIKCIIKTMNARCKSAAFWLHIWHFKSQAMETRTVSEVLTVLRDKTVVLMMYCAVVGYVVVLPGGGVLCSGWICGCSAWW
jgi:hypothetical protein